MSERWACIEGTDGAYEVSSYGKVRSVDRTIIDSLGRARLKPGRVLKPWTDKDGYQIVAIRAPQIARNMRVHRLVAQSFLPPSDSLEVNHKDFRKSNNAVSNLEWASRVENQEHAKSGGVFDAVNSPKRAKKLTIDAVSKIRGARARGETYASIAASFGITSSTAHKVVNNAVWKQAR